MAKANRTIIKRDGRWVMTTILNNPTVAVQGSGKSPEAAYQACRLAETEASALSPHQRLRVALNRWRIKYGFSAGFVVVNRGEIQGHTPNLNDSCDWAPGSIAYDNQGALRGLVVSIDDQETVWDTSVRASA